MVEERRAKGSRAAPAKKAAKATSRGASRGASRSPKKAAPGARPRGAKPKPRPRGATKTTAKKRAPRLKEAAPTATPRVAAKRSRSRAKPRVAPVDLAPRPLVAPSSSEEELIESAKYAAPAARRVFEEERFVFPETYGENRVRLLVKDPRVALRPLGRQPRNPGRPGRGAGVPGRGAFEAHPEGVRSGKRGRERDPASGRRALLVHSGGFAAPSLSRGARDHPSVGRVPCSRREQHRGDAQGGPVPRAGLEGPSLPPGSCAADGRGLGGGSGGSAFRRGSRAVEPGSRPDRSGFAGGMAGLERRHRGRQRVLWSRPPGGPRRSERRSSPLDPHRAWRLGMPIGYWCPVLHAHLPYVRHPEHPEFLEEDWFFEALTETYIPLVIVLDGLLEDGVDYRLTMTLSPPLVSMMTDALLVSRYHRYIDRLVELSRREIERTEREDRRFAQAGPDLPPRLRQDPPRLPGVVWLGHTRGLPKAPRRGQAGDHHLRGDPRVPAADGRGARGRPGPDPGGGRTTTARHSAAIPRASGCPSAAISRAMTVTSARQGSATASWSPTA